MRMDLSRKEHRAEFVIEATIRVLGLSSIAFVLLIFLFLLREGVPAFLRVPLANLFDVRWYPTFDLFGALPLILGSVLVTFTAIIMALPLGVASAVFVREVAPGWAREILKPMVEVLAGIPSVVIIFRQIIPQMSSILIVSVTLGIPGFILGETVLSYLGLGNIDPAVSWGSLLNREISTLSNLRKFPWFLYPGLFLLLTTLGFNFLGDLLRDLMDPYYRERKLG